MPEFGSAKTGSSVPSSSGSSSGSSGAGEVTVPCCSNPIPRVLSAEISGCNCLNGVVELTYQDSTNDWQNNSLDCGGDGVELVLACEAGTGWKLLFDGCIIGTDFTPDSEQCDPLELTFTVTIDEFTCSGTCAGPISVTITE